MKNRKRKNTIMVLLVLLLTVTIGYALIATTLKINGNATITKQTWNVYWGVPTVTEGSVSMTPPTRGADQDEPANTKLTWSATLNLPGDFYEFEVDAVNEGTIDAMITGITPTVTPTLPDYIKYDVTYADGMWPSQNHLLAKADQSTTPATPTRETYKVRVYYDETAATASTINNMTADATYTFNLELTYGQATDEAHPHETYLSMGDQNFGYQTRFKLSDWDTNKAGYVSENKIDLAKNSDLLMTNPNYFNSMFSRTISDNYMFSGRNTIEILHGDNYGNYGTGRTFILSSTSDFSDHLIKIIHDPDGDKVHIRLNNDNSDICVGQYTAPRKITTGPMWFDIWYKYNNDEKKFYVYVAEYDENGNISKPQAPNLECSVDISEVFNNNHTIYFKYQGQNGWYSSGYAVNGFEFNPYE